MSENSNESDMLVEEMLERIKEINPSQSLMNYMETEIRAACRNSDTPCSDLASVLFNASSCLYKASGVMVKLDYERK